MNENIPWTEKYRPSNFDNIVLDPYNKTLFMNMIENKYFPNLLLYGPPGTGKTTTIINLINEYQRIKKNKSLVIHLNASDERGIDIIRNQIYQFVKTKNLFETGYKFVVLDEVDYMTKNAQQALKYLLQTCGNNVKFFLICNYISKIELSLQHEFVCIRFNQLPKQKIREFIREICVKEGVDLTDQNIDTIQNLHKSDIRSMINFIQLNQNVIVQQSNIVDDTIWKRLYDLFDGEKDETKIKVFINKLSIHYNIDKKQIIKDYYNYLILNHPVTPEIIEKMEIVIHNYDCNIEVLINYFILGELRCSASVGCFRPMTPPL
jgi:DNA polymerase III delta prime subunit